MEQIFISPEEISYDPVEKYFRENIKKYRWYPHRDENNNLYFSYKVAIPLYLQIDEESGILSILHYFQQSVEDQMSLLGIWNKTNGENDRKYVKIFTVDESTHGCMFSFDYRAGITMEQLADMMRKTGEEIDQRLIKAMCLHSEIRQKYQDLKKQAEQDVQDLLNGAEDD